MEPHTIFETDTNQEHGSVMSSMVGVRPDELVRASGCFGDNSRTTSISN